METKFNFKSQICTDKNQSERLLALGLKKETADCAIYYSELAGCDRMLAKIETELDIDEIPAWSLHRLIEMMPSSIKVDDEDAYFAMNNYGVTFLYYYEGYDEMSAYIKFDIGMNTYDDLINCIKWLIKKGYFNKEYLEEHGNDNAGNTKK